MIAAGEAHLWYARVQPLDDPALLVAADGVLLDDEWARYRRHLFAEGRRQYLATRLLIRSVLSQYCAVEPSRWRFRDNEFGRPEVAGPPEGCGLRFNLSNTTGMVACVVSAHHEVGVDVESLRRRDLVDVAERFFAPAEVAALRALPRAAQHERFLEYWTLKESYIKARGMGLAIPLERFSFELRPPEPVRVSFDPRLGDDERAWQFAQIRPTADHLVAVAMRRPAGTAVRLAAVRLAAVQLVAAQHLRYGSGVARARRSLRPASVQDLRPPR